MADIDVLGGLTQQYPIGGYASGGGGDKLKPGLPASAVDVLEMPGFAGTQSLFNPYVIFSLHEVGGSASSKYSYTQHYDMMPGGGGDNAGNPPGPYNSGSSDNGNSALVQQSSFSMTSGAGSNGMPDMRTDQNKALRITPTAANIIEYNRNIKTVFGYGPTPYSWSDFLYCKYYGKIPNNHMVTLRRYPYPISDNVVVPNPNAVVPVAQAVTWFGEATGNKLSEILKMSYGVIWKEVEAQVQEVQGNEQAMGVGAESFLGGKVVSGLGAALTASRGSYDLWSGRQEQQVEWSKKAYTDSGPYWNQVYGPVNVVHKSHMRDRGLKFEQEISLVFEYDLSSYGGVNPKIAMLDLITNFLVLTYTNAKFWGGATRYFPNSTMRVGFLGDQSKFYSGDFGGYAKSVGTQIESTLTGLADSFTKVMNGDFSALKGMLMNMVLGKLTEKSMPQALSIRSMLSGDPVGEWHVTIGNPMNPIAVVGNLILMDSTIEFGDTLGADDFPTEVKFTVKLKPGKPRDKGDLESMFNNGYGRMSYAPLNSLPSEANTVKVKDPNNPAKDESEASFATRTDAAKFDELATGTYSKDSALVSITKRVTEQWGGTFGNSANLLFMINSTRSRF